MLTAMMMAGAMQGPLAHECSAVPVFHEDTSGTSLTVRDPIAHYGTDELRFDILRKGSRIGTSRLLFTRDNGGVIVDVETDISVNFLIFEAYRFEYRSRALWCEGRLAAMAVKVDDNGDRRDFSLVPSGDGLVAHGPDGQTVLPPGILPTNHWNPGVLDASRVFNTLTGNMNDIAMEQIGPDRIETANGPLDAVHYRYTGDLETEVWYDSAGRWVKLRFVTGGGETIEYRLNTSAITIEDKNESDT